MLINKAIRKQNKAYKSFMLSMGFIFLFLPIMLVVFGKFDIFYVTYLIIVELLICTAIIISMNNQRLKFEYDSYKLKITWGIFRSDYIIICDKVALVHVEGSGASMEIMLITTSKFRNKKIRSVDAFFLKTHPYISNMYYKYKKLEPEEECYYLIVDKGGFLKYKLLDTIYKSCVRAEFSEEAVEKVKEYRSSNN